jgi:hypothetical protein
MGKAAYYVHQALVTEAGEKGALLKDYNTTLLFTLVRQIDTQYFVASFWVGDGAIGIYTAEPPAVVVMGTPDGGAFAGETKFVTMPEIFNKDVLYNRFSIKVVPSFTALMLMTDGITDPKFGTDAALIQPEKWSALWADLQGSNDDGAKVQLQPEAEQPEQELLGWLDFWSPGNHDDRTLLILY